MEQPETPQEPAADPAVPSGDPTPPKAQLPDTKGVLPIPDHFRLPFHGKMVTPTAVPSAMERAYQMNRLQQRRRRRGFLVGLLAGQLLIIALDLGGELILWLRPEVKLQAPVRISSVVFLGMAAGTAVLLLAVALVYAGMFLKSVFGKRKGGVIAAAGGGIRRLVLTTLAMGVSIAVILGTAWFMIPAAEWKPTLDLARSKGIRAVEVSKAKVRSLFTSAPPAR